VGHDISLDAPEAIADLDTAEYRLLAEFRYQIRRYMHFSENAARAHGLEPRQYQLLLAVRGMPADRQPTIGEVARRLFLKHHTTVELVDRMVKLDVVRRERSMEDAREVRIRLTEKGQSVLRQLVILHRREIETRGAELARALSDAVANPLPGRETAVEQNQEAEPVAGT
jgi:DNA-binding MarR family transcriptional regulator